MPDQPPQKKIPPPAIYTGPLLIPDPPIQEPPLPIPPPDEVLDDLPDYAKPVDMHQLYTWTLGDGDNHCLECLALAGQTKTLAEWYRLNLVPPLHIGCKCSLKPSNPPLSGGKETFSMPNPD